jgi:hypothetical protein
MSLAAHGQLSNLALAKVPGFAGSIEPGGIQVSTVEYDETTQLGEAGAAKVETDDAATKPAEPASAAQPNHAALRGQIYTVLAREGINAAELINTALKKKEVGKVAPRRVEVIAPHGPSTSGGKKARQSITLVPVSGSGGTIMFGYLDVAQKVAELRDYAVVAQQYRARYGSRLEITLPEYEAMTKELTGLLGTLGFRIETAEEEAAKDAEEEQPDFCGGGMSTPKLVALAAGALVVCAVIALSLLR